MFKMFIDGEQLHGVELHDSGMTDDSEMTLGHCYFIIRSKLDISSAIKAGLEFGICAADDLIYSGVIFNVCIDEICTSKLSMPPKEAKIFQFRLHVKAYE